MDPILRTFSDSATQQAWWQSLTPQQQEEYHDAAERRNAERKRYGRELAPYERTMILSGDLHPSQIAAA